MIASSMLLFPDPFGPEIDTSPGSKFTLVVLKPNDLKPKISTFLCEPMCKLIAHSEYQILTSLVDYANNNCGYFMN
uniref:Uncharacterized protein n=1 Tax=uncultured marine thaumarchaeote AD1000_71_D06 TaxID=1455937 RepID=A0A075FXE5_9ARCH|nr:hypothetical protein [uncultured marine thaumarchaeote AD1000_71_D06]